MAEYIDREAALSAQNKSMNLAEMRKRLERIPAADVAPVVHAHWVWGETERDRPFCSNCLNDAFWDNDHGFVTENFCPNCGALMDKDGDGE